MFLNKHFSKTVALLCICQRRFKTDTIVTAKFFVSDWKIIACMVKPNVREFDTIHLQFNLSKMFELDNCVGSSDFFFKVLTNDAAVKFSSTTKV